MADGTQRGPWIVKSVWEHASLGLDDASVVRDEAAVPALLDSRAAEFGGRWFAEAYVPGRELNVAIIATADGPTPLPIAEIRFKDFPPEKPQIVGYAAKWHGDSFEYRNTVREFVRDSALAARAVELALRCWEAFELDGYARVDLRVATDGTPWVLEVNANPCLSPDAGFAAALAEAGIEFETAVAWLLDDARRRRRGNGTTWLARRRARGPPRAEATPKFRSRPRPSDLPALRRLVAGTDVFYAEELKIAVELLEERLARGAKSGYFFFFAECARRAHRLLHLGNGAAHSGELRPLLDRRCAELARLWHRPEAHAAHGSRGRAPRRRRAIHRNLLARRLCPHAQVLSPGGLQTGRLACAISTRPVTIRSSSVRVVRALPNSHKCRISLQIPVLTPVQNGL